MQSDQMRQQPKISPQQAEQMKKMGITVPETRNGGMVMKVCYTKKMLAKSEIPATQNDQECKPTNMSKSGNSFSGQIVCDGPNMKGTGMMQGMMASTNFQTNTSFTGTMGGQSQDANERHLSGRELRRSKANRHALINGSRAACAALFYWLKLCSGADCCSALLCFSSHSLNGPSTGIPDIFFETVKLTESRIWIFENGISEK